MNERALAQLHDVIITRLKALPSSDLAQVHNRSVDPQALYAADAVEADHPQPEDFAKSLIVLTDRERLVSFVGQCFPQGFEEVDRDRVFVAVGLLLAIGRGGGKYSGLVRAVNDLVVQMTDLLADDPARHKRASEFAVAYLLGWGRVVNHSGLRPDGIPENLERLAESLLRRSVESWLRWCIAHVPKFHEAVLGEPRVFLRQRSKIDPEHIRDLQQMFRGESLVWATRIRDRLTAAPEERCRCWVRALGKIQSDDDPDALTPSSNAGRRYQTCKNWHHVTAWRPIESAWGSASTTPCTFWAFLRRACNGFFGAYGEKSLGKQGEKGGDHRAGKGGANNRYNSLPSGLMWALWNDPDELERNLGRKLIVAKVLRRVCPDCKRSTFYRFCPQRAGPNGLSKAASPGAPCRRLDLAVEAEPDINGTWIVLAAGGPDNFNPQEFRICSRCKDQDLPAVYAADRGPKCPQCLRPIPGKTRTVYVWVPRSDGGAPESRSKGWIRAALLEVLEYLDSRRVSGNHWQRAIITQFLSENDQGEEGWFRLLGQDSGAQEADWAARHDRLADYSDRPATHEKLRDRFRSELLPIVIRAVLEYSTAQDNGRSAGDTSGPESEPPDE